MTEVSRAVLYSGGSAVPWAGLIACDEATSVGTTSSNFFFDERMKYAKLYAYVYPELFEQSCFGDRRRPFALSYYEDPDEMTLIYGAMVSDSLQLKTDYLAQDRSGLFAWDIEIATKLLVVSPAPSLVDILQERLPSPSELISLLE